MAKKDRGSSPTWVRFSGIGVEFAAAVIGFSLVGLWLDHHFGWSPWGVLVGAALGLIGGTYNLIRESLAAFKPPDDEDTNRPSE
ncbi:MAG: AtpZ/AtpI family protein [Planctomycetes bacterium]|nr:AtpZ/AtpI family protein [Planctomycetota bacterium]MBI3833012.1 AtpZ/AtpI family protein [Planctomycetota bacterium]